MLRGPMLRSVCNRKIKTEASLVVAPSRTYLQYSEATVTLDGKTKKILHAGDIVELTAKHPITMVDHVAFVRLHPFLNGDGIVALISPGDHDYVIKATVTITAERLDTAKLDYFFELYVSE